jgi:hypothetical protein
LFLKLTILNVQGISQCLLIVRLGLAKERLGDTFPHRIAENNPGDINKITITVCHETVTCDSDHNQFELEKSSSDQEGFVCAESSSLSETSVV